MLSTSSDLFTLASESVRVPRKLNASSGKRQAFPCRVPSMTSPIRSRRVLSTPTCNLRKCSASTYSLVPATYVLVARTLLTPATHALSRARIHAGEYDSCGSKWWISRDFLAIEHRRRVDALASTCAEPIVARASATSAGPEAG